MAPVIRGRETGDGRCAVDRPPGAPTTYTTESRRGCNLPADHLDQIRAGYTVTLTEYHQQTNQAAT